MSESARAHSEFLPQEQGFLNTVRNLIDSPPPGFHRTDDPEELGPIDAPYHYRAIVSTKRVEGYLTTAYKFEQWDGNTEIIARAKLPGKPTEDGRITQRHYILWRDGRVESMIDSFPDRTAIQGLTEQLLGAVASAQGIGGFGRRLSAMINKLSDDKLSSQTPEPEGQTLLLVPDEIAVVTSELQALFPPSAP